MNEKPWLPHLWIWNGQYLDDPEIHRPQFSSTIARIKPLRHGRNELYIPAERVEALLKLFKRWADDNLANMEGENNPEFSIFEAHHIMASKCAAMLEELLKTDK